MKKLCVALYMLLGAVLWLWFAFVQGGYILYALVGERFYWWAGIAGGVLASCFAGYSVNRIWRRATQLQQACLMTMGALMAATLIGVGLVAWLYAAGQRG